MKRGDREVAPFSFQALCTRLLEAGKRSSFSAGRIGRFTSSPPQFGQRSPRAVSAQERQNVHSKEQISASELAAGRSQSQFSQLGRSSSMALGSAQWVIAAVCSPSRAKRNGAKRAFRTECRGAQGAPKKTYSGMLHGARSKPWLRSSSRECCSASSSCCGSL